MSGILRGTSDTLQRQYILIVGRAGVEEVAREYTPLADTSAVALAFDVILSFVCSIFPLPHYLLFGDAHTTAFITNLCFFSDLTGPSSNITYIPYSISLTRADALSDRSRSSQSRAFQCFCTFYEKLLQGSTML
jgi:hypothetical protein